MLIKNWCITDGLCNGTRLQVLRCSQYSIRARILYGTKAGNEHTFCKTMFRPAPNSPVWFERLQYPFRLSFAMTINKSQGQTLDRVGIWLPKPVFAHGQKYTALSRGRSFEAVRVKIEQINEGENRQGTVRGHNGMYTKNIVDRTILF
jgi:ATP-dependent DNA helicase PIF1